MITLDNYEEYIMMQADGELQPHEEQALQVFLNDHPKLKAEMALYETVRLTPDHSLVYGQKESLMKPLPEKKVIAMPRFRTYAIAAGVAAIVVITLLGIQQAGNDNNNSVAKVETTTTQQHTTQAPIASNIPAPAASATDNSNTTGQQTTTNQIQVVKTQAVAHHNINTKNSGLPTTTAKTNNNAIAAASSRHQEMSSQQLADMKPLPVTHKEPEALQLASVAEYTQPNIETEAKPTWFDKLPIEEQKKKNLNNVAMAIANGCEQISELKENISKRSRGVSFKVQHKNLIVSF